MQRYYLPPPPNSVDVVDLLGAESLVLKLTSSAHRLGDHSNQLAEFLV